MCTAAAEVARSSAGAWGFRRSFENHSSLFFHVGPGGDVLGTDQSRAVYRQELLTSDRVEL